MTFKLSAGVYYKEYQKSSGIFDNVNSTIGACTFYSKKGPLGPHLVTGGNEEFIDTYGLNTPLNATLSPALNYMTMFYGNRVVNQARYAGLSLYYDNVTKKIITTPFATGTLADYKAAMRESSLLTVSTALTTNDVITLNLGSETITQNFNTNSNNTLKLLATQIKGKLDNLGDGANVQVIKAWPYSDRKTEIVLSFAREFEVNDIAKFTFSGDYGITSTDVDLTYTTGTATEFLTSIASALNANAAIAATAVDVDASLDGLPKIIITSLNAGPYTLTITPDATNTVDITTTVNAEGHGVFDDRVILIDYPENVEALAISGSIESTPAVTPAKTITSDNSAKLMDVFAENPGEWASSKSEGLGIKITNKNEGICQRTRLTINQAIAADNVFTCQISLGENAWTTNPIAFNTSSDNTLKLIADEIKRVMDENLGTTGSATVEEVTGGTENDRSILVITPKSNQYITINDAIFTGGQTQPIVVVSEIIPNTPSNETFDFNLYTKEDLKNPKEDWKATVTPRLDSNGNQLLLSSNVNEGVNASKNIRIVLHNIDFDKIQDMDAIAWLGGGDDGYMPTTSQFLAGWDQFADPEKITVRLLINAGYTNVSIQQKMASIAMKRRDCFAILDMPSDKQNPQDAYNYRQYELNVNTSYAAIYSPDVLVFDSVSGENIYVAPSGFVAAQICYTVNNSYIWFAAAGLNRGILDSALGVRVVYNEGDRDLLEPVQVNPILDKKANGIAIFGEYTLQVADGPLKDVHVRLLCNNIYISLTDAMQYKLFEPNDEYIRSVMVKEITAYLTPIKEKRGLRDFVVFSDITREPAAEVDAGVGYVKILIKPVSSLKFIMLENYILGSGVEFNEVILNGV